MPGWVWRQVSCKDKLPQRANAGAGSLGHLVKVAKRLLNGFRGIVGGNLEWLIAERKQ